MISPFQLHRPKTIEEACALLAQYGEQAKILAGGSELILLLKMNLAAAAHLIDIKGVAGMDTIRFEPESQALKVGGLVTHRSLETSRVALEHFPLLVEMENQVANIRVRNIGTLGEIFVSLNPMPILERCSRPLAQGSKSGALTAKGCWISGIFSSTTIRRRWNGMKF
jgi:CO/xanthine dehydrogenase FAD-binding subunit